jgi:hypothetical protein
MLRVFDFTCTACGTTREEFVDHDRHAIPCPCGGKASRQLAAPRLDWRHMGLDASFPSAWSKWAKAKREHHSKDKGGSEKGQNLKMH